MDRISDFVFQQIGGVTLIPLVLFLLAAVCALWVFFDAKRRMVPATVWKILAVLGAVVTLIIAVIAVWPDLFAKVVQYRNALAMADFVGFAMSLIGLVGLFVAPGQVAAPPPMDFPQTIPQPAPMPPMPEPMAPSQTQPMPEPMSPSSSPFGAQPVSEGTVILARKPSVLAWLIIRGGPRDGKEFRLGQLTKVGRDATQGEIVIDDAAMSRLHASIRLNEEEHAFYLTDLDSANGTFVNGEQITRQRLNNGDVVKCGETTFVFMRLEDKPKDKPAD